MRQKKIKAFEFKKFQELEKFFEERLVIELGTLSYLSFFGSSTAPVYVSARKDMIRWLRNRVWVNNYTWIDIKRLTEEQRATLVTQGYRPISCQLMGALIRLPHTGIAKHIRDMKENFTWSIKEADYEYPID